MTMLRRPGATQLTLQLPGDVVVLPRSLPGDEAVDDFRARTIRVMQKDATTTALRIDSGGSGYSANLVEIYDVTGFLSAQFTQNGTLQTNNTLWALQGVTTKYKSGAGVTIADVDFSSAPPNATMAIGYDTTPSAPALWVRANGVWSQLTGAAGAPGPATEVSVAKWENAAPTPAFTGGAQFPAAGKWDAPETMGFTGGPVMVSQAKWMTD